MKMSLDGFKRISSTDKTTTLQHPSGHQMTINHSVLSPKMRGDIAALPSAQKDPAGNKHPDKIAKPQFADGGTTNEGTGMSKDEGPQLQQGSPEDFAKQPNTPSPLVGKMLQYKADHPELGNMVMGSLGGAGAEAGEAATIARSPSPRPSWMSGAKNTTQAADIHNIESMGKQVTGSTVPEAITKSKFNVSDFAKAKGGEISKKSVTFPEDKHPDSLDYKTPQSETASRETKDDLPKPEHSQTFEESNVSRYAEGGVEEGSEKSYTEGAHPAVKTEEKPEGKPTEGRSPEQADKDVEDQNTANAAAKDQSKQESDTKAKYDIAGMGSEYKPNNIDKMVEAHKNLTDSHNTIIKAMASQSGQQPGAQDTNITAGTVPGADQTAAGIPAEASSPDQAGQPQDTNTPVTPVIPPTTAAQSGPTGQAAPGYTEPMNEAQQRVKDFQDYAQDHEAKNQELFNQVISNKIDPNRLVNNMSTVNRITNIIGLIMGGLGAGATGGKNMALNAMNEAINRDVDAQKSNQTHGINMYKMNLEATHNEEEARAMTINQEFTMAQAALTKQAAGNANTAAQQAAQLATQQIQAAKYQNIASAYKAKVIQEMQSGQGTGGQTQAPGAVNLDKLNKLEFAGIMPKEDVQGAHKEATQLAQNKAIRADFNDTFKKLDSKFLAGALTPGDRAAYVNALAAKIEHANVGRYNHDAVLATVNGLFPKGGDFASTRKDKLVQANKFFDINEAETPILNQYGLRTDNTQQPSGLIEGATGKLKDGTPVVVKNGQWVKR